MGNAGGGAAPHTPSAPPHRPGKFVYTASIRIETAEHRPAAAILGSGFAHSRLRAVPI